MRDVHGFKESRLKILNSRPALRSSWVAFAVANYLVGDYHTAWDVAMRYQNMTDERGGKYEESELLLFQNRCLELQGKYSEALEHLETNADKIVDRLALRIKTAELLVLLGRFAEAKEKWLSLTKEQVDNYRFHSGLQTAYLELDASLAKEMFNLKRLELPCMRLTLLPEQVTVLKDMYTTNFNKKDKAIKKIMLYVLSGTGSEFTAAIDEHLRYCLHNGIPALYHDICSLVRHPDPYNPSRNTFIVSNHTAFRNHPVTVETVKLVNGYISNLKSNGTFDASPASDAVQETPSSLLWALFLKCHLLEMSGHLENALEVIDEAIEHTPTALDMYIKKGKLLRKSGSLDEAANTIDYCRALDLQDRYLNNKTTKYLMRACRIQQAMDTIAMFTKHDGDPEHTLHDLQCNWYELEQAEAFARQKQWGMALKKFCAVQKHFNDYVEDLFDFHGFCIKKTTLRAYTDIMKMLDTVYTHKFYLRATKGAVNIFLYLVDHPEDIDGLGHLPAAERKKERAKLKKQKQKEEQIKAAKEKEERENAKWSGESSAAGSGGASSSSSKDSKDPDPTGEKQLTKNFLVEAGAWCSQLSRCATLCDASTLALICDVMIRRGKPVQACRALYCGLKTAPHHPSLTVMLVKFAMRVGKGYPGVTPFSMKPAISAAINAELSDIMNGSTDVKAFANKYYSDVATASSSNDSLENRLAAAKCVLLIDKADGKSRATSIVTDDKVWSCVDVTLDRATEVLKFIQDELKVEDEANKFRLKASDRFPRASVFNAPTVTATMPPEPPEDA